MGKYSIIFVFLLLLCNTLFAQSHRIGVNSELNIPGGYLKSIYKASPGVQLNYAYLNETNRGRNISAYGVSVGYTKLKPSQDTLFYLAGDQPDETGKAVFSEYTMLQFLVNCSLEQAILDETYLQFGISAGYIQVKYDYEIYDYYYNESGFSNEGNAVVAANLGLVFRLGDTFSISPFFRYSMFFSLGYEDVPRVGYNSNDVIFEHLFTTGLSFHFNF